MANDKNIMVLDHALGVVVDSLYEKLETVNTSISTLGLMNRELKDESVDKTINMLKSYRIGISDAIDLVKGDFDKLIDEA